MAIKSATIDLLKSTKPEAAPELRFNFVHGDLEVLPVTQETAQRFLDMDSLEGERDLSDNRLVKLARDFNCGNQRTLNWITAFCQETGSTIRVNGGHTSYLLAHGLVHPQGHIIHEHYQCETMGDVTELWAILDSHVSHRTKDEVLVTEAGRVPALNGITKGVMQKVSTALCVAHVGRSFYKNLTYREMAQYILENSDFAVWVRDIFPTTKIHMKQGVIYVAWVTYNVDRELATRFWTEVCHGGDHVLRNSPAVRLDTKLREGIKPMKRMRRDGRQTSIQWFDIAHYCFSAWRLYQQGKTVSELGTRYRGQGISGLNAYITQEGGGKIVSFYPQKGVELPEDSGDENDAEIEPVEVIA